MKEVNNAIGSTHVRKSLREFGGIWNHSDEARTLLDELALACKLVGLTDGYHRDSTAARDQSMNEG
jgi:hypothetical protein